MRSADSLDLASLAREKGHYIILCRLDSERIIRVGSLGELAFSPGYYAYVGSALGGLGGRLRRHLLKPALKIRWHIDHLAQHAEPVGAVWATARAGRECALATFLDRKFSAIRRFGSTDCRCPSHLFHSLEPVALIQGALEAFRNTGREPRVAVCGEMPFGAESRWEKESIH